MSPELPLCDIAWSALIELPTVKLPLKVAALSSRIVSAAEPALFSTRNAVVAEVEPEPLNCAFAVGVVIPIPKRKFVLSQYIPLLPPNCTAVVLISIGVSFPAPSEIRFKEADKAELSPSFSREV